MSKFKLTKPLVYVIASIVWALYHVINRADMTLFSMAMMSTEFLFALILVDIAAMAITGEWIGENDRTKDSGTKSE
jgi:hypothetical protein